ncbi:hypothetical protein MKZ38_006276 [Zalerion maritima]|uniref:C2H2-type domain-containing protein n=1 Tax=Zalerion maritima TaxID=339359 RepID=A0AAD5RK19_9PEZI|nr:hypothetical protein MKZ38_006276 [Zalerion maritima]
MKSALSWLVPKGSESSSGQSQSFGGNISTKEQRQTLASTEPTSSGLLAGASLPIGCAGDTGTTRTTSATSVPNTAATMTAPVASSVAAADNAVSSVSVPVSGRSSEGVSDSSGRSGTCSTITSSIITTSRASTAPSRWALPPHQHEQQAQMQATQSTSGNAAAAAGTILSSISGSSSSSSSTSSSSSATSSSTTTAASSPSLSNSTTPTPSFPSPQPATPPSLFLEPTSPSTKATSLQQHLPLHHQQQQQHQSDAPPVSDDGGSTYHRNSNSRTHHGAYNYPTKSLWTSSLSQSPAPTFASTYIPNVHIRTQPDLLGIPDLDSDVDGDIEMTTGPALDAAVSRSRQDSFVSAGPKPISMAGNPNRDHRGRRESFAGSLMGGMSWGGLSVGSFIRDDLIMAGTSPFAGQHQSPSLHSSSYLPKLEANFMRDFTCCGRTLPTLHDLLQHYEEAHHNAANPTNPTLQNLVPVMGQSGPRRNIPASMAGQSMANPNQSMGQGVRTMAQQSRHLGPSGLGQMHMSTMAQMQNTPISAPPRQPAMTSHLNDEMDAVGEMEMDDPVGMGGMEMEMDGLPTPRLQNNTGMFGQPHQQQQPRPQLQLNNAAMTHQALRTSQPPTPAAGGFGFQNNPTVSSVNTPTLTTQQQPLQMRSQPTQSTPDTPVGAPQQDFSNMNMGMNFGNMNLNTNTFGNANNNNSNFGGAGFTDFAPLGTIDDPAKRLFSPGNPGGAPDSATAMQQQLAASFNLTPEQLQSLGASDQKALLAMLMPEEHKPFKCPVIGCEKAYKNQNGLKYHKQHGHATQQLHENGDGTFSIVDPETSTPYPGTLGMEKEKPFKCEVCSKRYKNLNGLKYHKQHSPYCTPEALAALTSGNLALNLGALGLPNIGEDAAL